MQDIGIFSIVVIVVLVLAGGSILFTRMLEKKRREAFEAAANGMGLSYSQQGPAGMLQQLSRFKLFDRGYSKKIENVISGDAGEVAISIFDYRYTTGSGKNKNTHRQSVISLSSPQLHCPDLRVRPENFFDRFGSALGFQDIDFEEFPKFSQLFVLQGDHEEQIRSFLKPPVIEWMENKPGISLEAVGQTLFFYRPRKRIKPEEIKDSLAEAYEIFGLLVDAG